MTNMRLSNKQNGPRLDEMQVISDLLKPERTNLTIREDKKKGVFVEGLSEWVVRSPAEIYGLMERGAAQVS